ncbi:hypothetical protein VTL71DRAFT_7113 [Oculimacula yallundae]|uniref:Uncharacterized protein n=1 Tax=Oculimacula yallundae TaxID=86028 RepID=A0ABR4BVS2_9HELO
MPEKVAICQDFSSKDERNGSGPVRQREGERLQGQNRWMTREKADQTQPTLSKVNHGLREDHGNITWAAAGLARQDFDRGSADSIPVIETPRSLI